MAGRWPLVVGITTIAAVVAWFVLRDDDLPSPKSQDGSGALTPKPALPAPNTPPRPDVEWGTEPERPALPPVPPPDPPPPGTPTADGTFEAQTRDDVWARRIEGELRKRMRNVRGGKLDDIECRESTCRIIVVGSEAEVAKTVDELEGPRGLHGYAKSLLLTAPERKPDGSIVLRVYPQFAR